MAEKNVNCYNGEECGGGWSEATNQIMSDEFQNYWRDNFPNCPPVSYIFKDKLNEFWFRIHNLPQSKRYAENEDEMREILRRQKILFNDVIGEEENCFVVCLGYDNKTPVEIYKVKFPALTKLLSKESESISLQTIDPDEETDIFFPVCFGRQKITFKILEQIFVAIADDEINYLFVLDPKLKRIFAPYDGGVDVILERSAKRDEFKKKYKDWLSSRTDGL
ncbi:MAG: DUF3885 domain-containing protein [Pyrinomonadaceae bacterium]